MDTLDQESLVALAGHQGWPALSLYMPAHRAGTGTRQDPIRLKNLLKTAENMLVDGGMRAPEAAALLAPAWRLQSDPAFWRDGFDGLALFIADSTFVIHRTAVALPERVRIGEHFLIRPLLPALAPPLRFVVLALSKSRVRLLEGTAEEVREIDPAGIPQGLAEALKYDDYESQVHFHSRTPAAAAGRGKRTAMFHGHGGHADTAKDALERYFRLVDKGLRDLIGPAGTPLLLAGVDYLLPIYRSVNTYRDLLPEALTGNPDGTPAATLHAEALGVLEPYLNRRLHDDLTTLRGAREGASATETIEDVVLAAHAGRVETLFVADEPELWGSVMPGTGEVVERGEPPVAGATDLLDRAAAQTLLHGGAVHVLAVETAEAMLGSPAAAVLRY